MIPGFLAHGFGKVVVSQVSRGVAVWKGRVYVAAFDGRLIALDAATGRPVWSTDTTASQAAYTITGAPRVVKGKVIIGNGGADFGVRGYISAYDAMSGKLAWRFYIVPGDPKKGFEYPQPRSRPKPGIQTEIGPLAAAVMPGIVSFRGRGAADHRTRQRAISL